MGIVTHGLVIRLLALDLELDLVISSPEATSHMPLSENETFS